MLDNTSSQPSKFRTRKWVEINDESRGTYTSNNIKFKTTMLRSMLRAWTCLKARYSLRDYRNVLISFAFNLEKYFEVVFNF